LNTLTVRLANLVLLLLIALPVSVTAQTDSLAVPEVGPPPGPRFWRSPFDSVSGADYTATHSFSFDNYLEYLPGVIIARSGPIGAPSAWSRFGIGRGRGRVYLGHVPLNDPQDDRAPLGLIPTTAWGMLLRNTGAPGRSGPGSAIEGSMRLIEPEPAGASPQTALDLSTGDRPRLRQNRARFLTAPARVGLDFGYDELRSSGYDMDARGLVGGRDYGRSTTRVQSGALRGRLGTDRYRIGFRDFESTFQGDATSSSAQYGRNGYIAVVESEVEHLDVNLFQRSYRVWGPDSVTSNVTTAFYGGAPVWRSDASFMRVEAGYEDITSSQQVGGASGDERLQTTKLSVTGRLSRSERASLLFDANVAAQFDYASAWGLGAQYHRSFGDRHRVSLHARRAFRLPNLGELFLPSHARGSAVVEGHRNLGAESSIEAGAGLLTYLRHTRNELRVLTMRIDPIMPVVIGTGSNVISPRNADAQSIHMVEDRFDTRGRLWGFDLMLTAGLALGLGTRDGYFEGVPGYKAGGSAAIGRGLFRNTSGLLFTVQYETCGERKDQGHTLPSYGVLNLKLDVRLVDFRAYLMYLNLSNEEYQTAWPFLMTPRTFVYGASWLFNT
jgi:hypothetical protein